jgi:hypothetical protein
MAITLADGLAGFVVVLMGFEILMFPFNLIEVIFNFWLWIVLPVAILLFKNKEHAK